MYLVTRREINGFRIRRSYLLDKLFTIAITITQKSCISYDATWLVRRLSRFVFWLMAKLVSSVLSSALFPSVLTSSQFSSVLTIAESDSESESYVTTDGQSASLSWYKAPIWGLRPEFYCRRSVLFGL
jgi:hypothetical protein